MKGFDFRLFLILFSGLVVFSCKTTGGSSGEANESKVRSEYDKFIDQQKKMNSEYSNGTSRQPRDLSEISPRLLKDTYFKRAIEHKELAEKAMGESMWTKAKEHLGHALAALKGFEANRIVTQAEELLKVVRRRGLDKAYPLEFEKGVSALTKSISFLDAGNFGDSLIQAKDSVTVLRKIHAGLILVNEYTVVSGDCLWRISSKEDVYNDAYRWPKIYMANKNKLRDLKNPDLIYPGQVFDIPRY